MSNRDNILKAVKQNQPELLPLPNLDYFSEITEEMDHATAFTRVIEDIGAKVFQVNNHQDIIEQIKKEFKVESNRIVSVVKGFEEIAEPFLATDNHQWADVELMILPAQFAVAENGASWVDDGLFKERVLPFIPQHLVLILRKEDIVPTMHQAYQIISDKKYGFGTFIAGPSKTADIEQSLVLGAHGPRSLRVFLIV
jgi:L-lactate dehydrogenase complex protein LldG